MGVHRRWVMGGSIVLVALVGFIAAGYWFAWDWTGFPARKLWDWLGLLGTLAVPVVVGLGTLWFTRQQGKVSEAENSDNQREAALQAYIDKLSELLLEKHLRDSHEEDEVRKVARVRTLTVLPHLDKERKRSVLQFLYESGLIQRERRIIDLSGADFRTANLRWMHLEHADLRGALLTDGVDLREAHLNGADLRGAYFRGADLSSASLRGANLSETRLNRTKLVKADLRDASLHSTFLQSADLSEALVTPEQLTAASSLEGAIMPDGAIHP
jgi:hypothetical protein